MASPSHTELKSNPPKNEALADLIKDPAITKTFVNGFQVGFTASDAHVIFKYDNVPLSLNIMGLPAMKTLHENLGKLLGIYEQTTGQKVLSTEEISQNMNLSKVSK